MSERNRITVDLDEDVAKMFSKATTADNGRKPWGIMSFLVNDALRDHLTRKGFGKGKRSKGFQAA